MASGGDGSRNVNKRKGPMQNLLEHIGDAVTYDDVTFQQFLQDWFGSDHPSSPNLPLIIPEFDGLDPYSNIPILMKIYLTPQPLGMIFLQVKWRRKADEVRTLQSAYEEN